MDQNRRLSNFEQYSKNDSHYSQSPLYKLKIRKQFMIHNSADKIKMIDKIASKQILSNKKEIDRQNDDDSDLERDES